MLLQRNGSFWKSIKIVIKTSWCNCFLERANHKTQHTPQSFFESQPTLLNAYNEKKELSHSSYSLFNYIALHNANNTI